MLALLDFYLFVFQFYLVWLLCDQLIGLIKQGMRMDPHALKPKKTILPFY